MAKPDTRFKQTSNRLLDFIRDQMGPGDPLPGEEMLARANAVSRTTVRAVLDHLTRLAVIARDGRARVVLRAPQAGDYFGPAELVGMRDQIRQVFLDRISQRSLLPGQAFSESELAREAGASPPSVREFLIDFSRFGLIEKRPRGGWLLRSFDAAFARELADLRDMLELRAIEEFRAVPPDDTVWTRIAPLTARHVALRANIETQFDDFRALDRDFHHLLIGVLANRFIDSFYDIVSFIFHYHYQWNMEDEKERNFVALGEHLEILRALDARDYDAARDRLGEHLATARRTLLRSIEQSHSIDADAVPDSGRVQ